MKKIVLILLLGVFTQNLFAQEFQAKAIAGVTASQIDGDMMAGFNKFGGMGGMATNFFVSEKMSLQQEAILYMRGSKAAPKYMSFRKYQMNYLDLNLLANYHLSEDFFAQFGLGYGILMSAKMRSDFGFESDMPTAYGSNFTVQGGVGYMLSDKMEGNVRYLYSVLPAATDGMWHNSFSFSLRYHL